MTDEEAKIIMRDRQDEIVRRTQEFADEIADAIIAIRDRNALLSDAYRACGKDVVLETDASGYATDAIGNLSYALACLLQDLKYFRERKEDKEEGNA